MPSLPRLKNSDNFAQWATKINDAFTQFESFTSVSLDTTDPQPAEFAIYDASFKNKALSTYYVTSPTTIGELTIGASGVSNNMAPGEYGLIFTGGAGTGATGVARLSYGSTGVYVSSITLANSGTGYTSAPTVTIAGATGFTTNYSIIASSPYNNEGDISVSLRTDNYRVGGVIQANAGSGYSSTPDVTISNPPFVVGATGFVGSSGTLFGATGFAQNTIVMTTVGGVPATGNAQYRFYKATKAIADSTQVPYHSSGISGNWLFVGRRATATATVTNTSVTSVTITDKGYGYTSTAATITFSGSGGASYTAKMYSDAIASLTPNSIYNKNNVSSLTDVIRSNNFLCIYDSTTDSLKKIAISVITPDIPTGAVLFGSPTDSYTWDYNSFYWDDVNNRLGLLTNSPDALLTVNGVGAFGDGTVSAPSIANTGDLNTGFWFPAADTIAASTAGSERVRIDSSGNVGIGTSSPSYSLDVNGAIRGRSDVFITKGSSPYFGTTDAQDLRLGTNTTERMRIISTGEVGIGTSNPLTRLHVGAVAGAGGTDGNVTLSAGTNMFYQVATSGAALTWNANTNGGLSNTVMARLQPRQDTSANYNLDVFCGTWNNDNSAGTAIATFQSTGNVGIGTTIPGYKLDVSGDINVSSGSIYRINGTSVLTSTTLGSGVVTSSLTTVGTIGTGVWQGTVIAGQYGGTGVANTGRTITLGGNISTAGALTTSGAFALTLTTTATTNATLPSGTTTLVPTDGTGATGTWSISITGNAATATTATKLSSSKTISLTGSVTGSTSTDFTGNVSINTSLANQNSDALPSTIVVRDGSGSFNINVLGATGVALNTGASTSVRLEGISGATGIIRFPTSNSGTVVTTTDSGTVTSTMIADGTIVNGDISGSAAIAKSKLAITNAIVDADINTSAAIAVSKLAASTISGIVLGNNLNSLTLATSGVGLSGSGSYNGSGAVTFTVTSDATHTNTPSKLVSRDVSGNFAGGTITAATTFSGPGTSLTNLPAGQLTGTIPSGVLGNSSLFVGTTSIALNRASANLALTGITSINAISIPASSGNFVATGDTGTVTNNMLAGSIAYNKLSLVGAIVNADISATASIAISKLASSTISGVSLGNNLNTLTLNTTGTGISGSGSYNGSGAVTFTVTANSVALSATPNSLVLRDGNGDFTGRYINSTYFASTDDVSNGTISYIVAKFSPDNYYRSATAAKVAAFISGQTMNITGSASSAVTLSTNQSNWSSNGTISAVVGQLAWKNYGNSHTIFDASAGTSPSGGAVNNTNPQSNWTSTYPTLMGWNGSATYGVRVDSSRLADSVTNGVYTIGDQTIGGTKTFSSTVAANITGTSFNITQYTINQSVGTANSPSFAGLTVDTNTLYVNSANDRVGIGTTSPTQKLQVVSDGAGNSGYQWISSTNNGTGSPLSAGFIAYLSTADKYISMEVNNGSQVAFINSNAYDMVFGIGAAEKMRYTAATDRFGIGTSNPSYKLHVVGDIYATGDVYAGSDIRMKENITELTNALDKIKNLQGYSYNKIGVNHRSIGLMAQDVEKIIPEVVSRNTEGMKGIDYGQMIAMLVEAIKELSIKLEAIDGTTI